MSELDPGLQVHTHFTGFVYYADPGPDTGEHKPYPVRFELDDGGNLVLTFVTSSMEGERDAYIVPRTLLEKGLDLLDGRALTTDDD